MDKQEKKFIGVWIEAYVWNSRAINLIEKALLTEIIIFNKGDKGCFANNKYFAEMFDLSEDRISKLLTGLRRKGLINIELKRKNSFEVTKRIITVNDVEKALQKLPDIVRKVKNTYVDNVGKNDSHQVGENNSNQIGENTEYNSITNNNNITKDNIKETSAKPPSASKVRYEESNPYYQLANYLYQSILRNDPKAKQPNMQTWSDEIRKLVEIDERDIMDVKDIVTFATNHHFWKKNILSTKKLRDKFSTLYIEFNDKPKSYGQKKYQQPTQQVTSKEFNYDGAEDWSNPKFD